MLREAQESTNHTNLANSLEHYDNYWSPLKHLVEECYKVKEDDSTVEMELVSGKGKIRFCLPRSGETLVKKNKTAMKWRKRIHRRRINQMANAEANEFSMLRLQQAVARNEESISKCAEEVMDTWYEQVFGTTDCVNDGNNTTPENTGIYDTGCTSGVTTAVDAQLMHPTGRRSNKVFHMPLGNSAQATEVYKMRHKLRQPVLEMNELPELQSTLVSGVKIADADYVSVIDKKRVRIYDPTTTNVKATGPPVLQGWRVGNLWRIPLIPKVTNVNTDTRIVECPQVQEAIANVFEMPTVAKTIAYTSVPRRDTQSCPRGSRPLTKAITPRGRD